VGNVVEKEKPDRQPAHEVEPNVAVACREVDLCLQMHFEE
jgi:hypothetical protein